MNKLMVALLLLSACTGPELDDQEGKVEQALPGASGATLQASKTLDICQLPDGAWRCTGAVSVWNEGVNMAEGLNIDDCLQTKNGKGQYADAAGFCLTAINGATSTVAGLTPEELALVFTYTMPNCQGLAGDIRNIARVTISNHSGGRTKGPEPKATFVGPPPACPSELGCTYTQGYWGNKPGVVWPEGYDRAAPFFYSGLTWQQILDAPAGGNGYIILAKQYIAAVLSAAKDVDPASVPAGVQGILEQAAAFFTATTTTTPATACPTNSSCGLQKTWGGILDTFNNGNYLGGPPHCGDADAAQ